MLTIFLLGADVFPSILNGKWVTLGDKLPVDFSLIFGWIFIGPFPVTSSLPLSSPCLLDYVCSNDDGSLLVSRRIGHGAERFHGRR